MRNCGCVGVGVVGLNMGVKQVLPVPRFISAVHFRNWEAAAEEVLIFGLGETRTAASQRVGQDDADGSRRPWKCE